MSRLWFLFTGYVRDTDNSFGKMNKTLRIASAEIGNTGVRQINFNTISWEEDRLP